MQYLFPRNLFSKSIAPVSAGQYLTCSFAPLFCSLRLLSFLQSSKKINFILFSSLGHTPHTVTSFLTRPRCPSRPPPFSLMTPLSRQAKSVLTKNPSPIRIHLRSILPIRSGHCRVFLSRLLCALCPLRALL